MFLVRRLLTLLALPLEICVTPGDDAPHNHLCIQILEPVMVDRLEQVLDVFVAVVPGGKWQRAMVDCRHGIGQCREQFSGRDIGYLQDDGVDIL